MQRYVALLSGLPAGTERVADDQLASLFRNLGFLDVRTLEASGTVAFDTRPVGNIGPLEAQISRHLTRSLKHKVRTFIRTSEEIATLVDRSPFASEDGSVYVVFLDEKIEEDVDRRLRARRSGADSFRPAGREIYWLRRKTEDNEPPPPLAELLNAPATVRSIQSLRHVAEESVSSDKRNRDGDATESERSRQ